MNFGNPAEISIFELANRVIELTNSTSRIEFLPAISDDPRQRRPDIGLARSRRGWRPTTDLETGLAKVIACYRRRARLTGSPIVGVG